MENSYDEQCKRIDELGIDEPLPISMIHSPPSFNSSMSRIATYVESITDSEQEEKNVCKELSLYWNKGKDYKSLSKKAKATICTWEAENGRKHEVNKDLVNEWEGE